MLEIPETHVLARQANESLVGAVVASARANASPHSFCWYFGNPDEYGARLTGKRFTGAKAFAGHLIFELEDMRLTFNDGANTRLIPEAAKRPAKHQLLMELQDGRALCVTIAMYGGVMAYKEGEYQNAYLDAARNAVSPLTDAFSPESFDEFLQKSDGKLSMKALLATEQRIPGLGNGVLQDILYEARLHPKRRLSTLKDAEREALYASVTGTLRAMTAQGGRDVERDLYGAPGGYATRCSRLTLSKPCPRCGAPIQKEPYMGGTVYLCPGCQTL